MDPKSEEGFVRRVCFTLCGLQGSSAMTMPDHSSLQEPPTLLSSFLLLEPLGGAVHKLF